jgi:hypothetical protein
MQQRINPAHGPRPTLKPQTEEAKWDVSIFCSIICATAGEFSHLTLILQIASFGRLLVFPGGNLEGMLPSRMNLFQSNMC